MFAAPHTYLLNELGRRIMLKASSEYQPDCRTDRCRVIAYAKAHTAVYAKGITKLMV
jgi:hypothetical protein